MEKILKRHDKERLRSAILEQEETFRLQVHELHRLYRVQKQLMKEMKSSYSTTPKSLERRSRGAVDLQLPAEAHIQDDGGDYSAEIEAESEIVLTLAIGSGRRKRDDAGNTSDSAGSLSTSSAESGTKKTAVHGWGLSEIYLTSKSDKKFEFDMKKSPWLLPCLSLSMS